MFIYIEHKQDVNIKMTIIKDELERLCTEEMAKYKTQTNQTHKTRITKDHGKSKTSEITSCGGGRGRVLCLGQMLVVRRSF